MNEKINPRRKLGTGHYDRKLMERMVELSEADTYEEASEEWLATGNVYWGSIEVPEWWPTPKKCLCGHRIEYHFEVQNEKNDNLILVGSDHINTYHILRHIVAERRQRGEVIHADDITDEMIDEWLSERVASMKQTAWWHNFGQQFENMFNEIKEYDLRVNVRVRKWQYDSKYGISLPVTQIRKVSKGTQGEDDYQMASIVWRWNHPDNPKAQINTRGYPNDKLWLDTMLFHHKIEEYKSQCEEEDIKLSAFESMQHKRNELKHAQISILNEDRLRLENALIKDMCDYYGIPDITTIDETTLNDYESTFIKDVRFQLKSNNRVYLSDKQKNLLKKIMSGERVEEPATYRQIRYLVRLGYQENTDSLNKAEASRLIDELIKSGAKPEY